MIVLYCSTIVLNYFSYTCTWYLNNHLLSEMIGYGMAKAAVHQLTKSLASEKSGLPKNSLAVAILPITLDTPMNRKWMPNADFSTWTSLDFVAK